LILRNKVRFDFLATTSTKFLLRKLKYSASDKKLKVTLTYDGNPIKVGEKFLALLVPVNESEITSSTTPEFKIYENTPAHVPEVVNF
jgi:hypothetical protein